MLSDLFSVVLIYIMWSKSKCQSLQLINNELKLQMKSLVTEYVLFKCTENVVFQQFNHPFKAVFVFPWKILGNRDCIIRLHFM